MSNEKILEQNWSFDLSKSLRAFCVALGKASKQETVWPLAARVRLSASSST